MNVLQAIGYGIVGFAVIIVIGIVVITKLGDSVATCPAVNETYNITDRHCWDLLNGTKYQSGTPTDGGYVSGVYLSGQLGSSGLAGWIPAVIAVMIGGLFLAYFGGKKNKQY